MDDKELLDRFEEYIKDRGYTADQAAKVIGVSRNSLFNWRNGRPISARARHSIRILLVNQNPCVKSDDPFLEIILDNWKFLTTSEKGKISGDVAELAATRKGMQKSDGKSA